MGQGLQEKVTCAFPPTHQGDWEAWMGFSCPLLVSWSLVSLSLTYWCELDALGTLGKVCCARGLFFPSIHSGWWNHSKYFIMELLRKSWNIAIPKPVGDLFGFYFTAGFGTLFFPPRQPLSFKAFGAHHKFWCVLSSTRCTSVCFSTWRYMYVLWNFTIMRWDHSLVACTSSSTLWWCYHNGFFQLWITTSIRSSSANYLPNVLKSHRAQRPKNHRQNHEEQDKIAVHCTSPCLEYGNL